MTKPTPLAVQALSIRPERLAPHRHHLASANTACCTTRAVLQRIVVLSTAPDIDDLPPALLDLTDYVFQRAATPSTAAAVTPERGPSNGASRNMSEAASGSSVQLSNSSSARKVSGRGGSKDCRIRRARTSAQLVRAGQGVTSSSNFV